MEQVESTEEKLAIMKGLDFSNLNRKQRRKIGQRNANFSRRHMSGKTHRILKKEQ